MESIHSYPHITMQMEKIIKKIVKGVPFQEHKKIHQIVTSHTQSLHEKMQEIHTFLRKWNLIKPLEENRQTFICEKLVAYLKRECECSHFQKMIDIGGGNGNVLEYLGNEFQCLPEHLLCVDKKNTEFAYACNKEVTYMESDVFLQRVEPFDAHLIVCMVSLHHMEDAELFATIDQIWRNMAPGGYLFIKEHDCQSIEDKWRINWEHHLYHLMETPHLRTGEYISKFIGNYKSREYHTSLFTKKGFELIQTFNNILEPILYATEINTPTRLYWTLFIKPKYT